MLLLLALLALRSWAAGPADLARLQEGQAVGAYRAKAVYLDPAGEPKGARFIHSRGMPVDVLFFASVPQVSLVALTPPESDKGESHTLEHLLLGKGRSGRRLNTLMPLRMGDYTAATDSDITNYQLSTAAGPAEFYELLETFLHALLRPDFTDEEARREVAHFAVTEEGGRLKLEEKGTVYNEMVSRMEKPDSIAWYQLSRMRYGPNHPLGRNQGGEPEEIWKLTPTEIRRFHAAHYRLGPNMALIAALPMQWSADDFLARLDGIMRRVEPEVSSGPPAALPPLQPGAAREPWIGRFPSEDSQAPQNALFAWPAVATFTREEEVRLSLALGILADGESAYLYRDLVDQKTRRFDSGATGVGSYTATWPVSHVMLYLTGLPVSSLTTSRLQQLRGTLLERLRWLHDLGSSSPDFLEAAGKTRALMRSSRRAALKSMDGPPGFEKRSTGSDWHRFLDHLDTEPKFRKPLFAQTSYDQMLRELEAVINPWAKAIERAGLLSEPFAVAVLPDAELLRSQRDARAARLKAESDRLATRYGTDSHKALELFRTEQASATAALEAPDPETARPSFLKEPPLTLDELEWSKTRLASGPRLVRTHFPTPFTDIHLAFDLRGMPPRDYELLPLLAEALSGVGVTTRSGERLDYAQVEDRLRSEVYSAGVSVSVDPVTERAELGFHASASSPEELGRAVEWLENFMLRPSLGPEARERLIDQARASIQGWRAMFQQDEESWIQSAAAAYEYQDQPLYMAAHSPFTALRHLNRLRWRLEEPEQETLTLFLSTLTAVAQAAARQDRAAVSVLLTALPGELGEYLRWELSHFPEDSWRKDLWLLCSETLADLGRAEETIRRLRNLGRSLLVRSAARAHLNGSRAHLDQALPLVDTLLGRLLKGGGRTPSQRRPVVLERLRDRFPALQRPTHVALVHPGGKTAAISVSTPGPRYTSRRPQELVETLTAGVLAGGGAHSLFMRTWAAGLAYANGLSASRSAGSIHYYADRCLDPVQTLRFVAEVGAKASVRDPFFLEYSLAGAFGDYRADSDFSSRGAWLAADLEDGRAPEVVRGFKTALVRLARGPGALEAVRASLGQVLGRVLIGFPGGRVSAARQATAFLVAPEQLLAPYEAFIKESGEADRLIRLYPRDFWP